MALPVLFFFAAITVRSGQTPLRSGCDAKDDIVANLPAGTPVELRFRLSDGSDCFKVSTIIDGKDVLGYLPASALTGLAGFDEDQAAAATITILSPAARSTSASKDVNRPAEPYRYVMRSKDPALHRAADLLNSNPAQALEELQVAIQHKPRDPDALLLAGLAAYRSDQLREALDYWKRSLEIAPDEALAAAYEELKREAESDRSGERLYGAHIALRYEGEALPVETARAIVAALDDDYSRISAQLGCSPTERIIAIVQSRESYLHTTGAAEWSGGQYDGRIHIAWPDGAQFSPQMQRALAHELVHACLTSIPSGSTPWPAWLQEGLAQKLSGETLPTAIREQLRKLAQTHTFPKLESLQQDWSRMSAQNAIAAYNLALAAADALYDNYANYGIRNILTNPDTLPRITADLDTKLGL